MNWLRLQADNIESIGWGLVFGAVGVVSFSLIWSGSWLAPLFIRGVGIALLGTGLVLGSDVVRKL